MGTWVGGYVLGCHEGSMLLLGAGGWGVGHEGGGWLVKSTTAVTAAVTLRMTSTFVLDTS